MYNFCTLSYSLAFASAEDWQFQVDWMALHGINAPLGAIGTEYVQGLMYSQLGLSEQEILDFFPGPAFLGWNRMSDMDGPWSGPLSADWRQRRASVAALTFNQMRALGMNVIRMGFSGHVPCAIETARMHPLRETDVARIQLKLFAWPERSSFSSTRKIVQGDTEQCLW